MIGLNSRRSNPRKYFTLVAIPYSCTYNMTRVTEVATTAAIVIVTYLALVFELLPVPQTFQEEIVPVVRIRMIALMYKCIPWEI
jgi:hypothetical protein